MAYVIAGLVAIGLIAYLAASFVGVGDDPKQGGLGIAGPWLRRVLDWLLSASPILLAILWIAYGLLHLTMPASSGLQMPPEFGKARDALWGASGAFEIAIGLLVVEQRWRRWALLGQLLMLVALTPFVVYMLTHDAAVQDVLRGMPAPLGRVVLVFHNLLLFVWTARIYRDELKRLGSKTSAASTVLASKSTPPAAAAPATQRKLEPVLIVAAVMLAANLAGCLTIAVGPWMSGSLYLWAMGSLATGALVGFLFGVPRWIAPEGNTNGQPRGGYQPNTNIEMLSDWLTKMFVGVGLVELHELGPILNRTAAVLARGLTLRSERHAELGESQAFATGLLAFFLVAGIIEGFLLTRMFLTRAWNREA
jgi:uncharacterized membrane protein